MSKSVSLDPHKIRISKEEESTLDCETPDFQSKVEESSGFAGELQDRARPISGSETLDQGTVIKEGDMLQFVTADLETKIRQSTPPSQGSSRSESSSLRQQVLDALLPPIDPTVMIDIERHAKALATSADDLIENLSGTLHSISSLTVDSVEAYKSSVRITCDGVDANIRSMYQLMAKCEELSKSMPPVYRLALQVKEVRRLLELFETEVNTSSGRGTVW